MKKEESVKKIATVEEESDKDFDKLDDDDDEVKDDDDFADEDW